MKSDFLIVHKKILPDYLEKVIQARNLLARHEADTVTEAVRKAGISRNTYYKYKDFVYEQTDKSSSRNAVISLILKDESGALSSLLNTLTGLNTSILTISQSVPIAGKANILISLDISQMQCRIEEMTDLLKKLPAVKNVHIDAIE
jgi:chorismate mutase